MQLSGLKALCHNYVVRVHFPLSPFEQYCGTHDLVLLVDYHRQESCTFQPAPSHLPKTSSYIELVVVINSGLHHYPPLFYYDDIDRLFLYSSFM